MSTVDNRLTASLESHPRLTRALFAALVLLTYGVSTVAAGGGSGATIGG